MSELIAANYADTSVRGLSAAQVQRSADAFRVVGEIAYLHGDLDRASGALDESARRLGRLGDEAEDHPKLIVTAARLAIARAKVRADRGGGTESIQELLDADRRLETLGTLDSAVFERSRVRLLLTEQLARAGRIDEAAASLERATDLARGALREESRAGRKVHLARTLIAEGIHFSAWGATPSALASLEEAERFLAPLVADYPVASGWIYELSRVYYHRAQAHLALGDFESARAALEQDHRLNKELLAIDPKNTRWRSGLAWTKVSLSRLHRLRGDAQSALPLARDARKLAQEVLALEPTNPRRANLMALSEIHYGAAQARLGDVRAALDAWRQALDRVEPLTSDGQRLDYLNTYTLVRSFLGLWNEAKAGMSRLHAAGSLDDLELTLLASCLESGLDLAGECRSRSRMP